MNSQPVRRDHLTRMPERQLQRLVGDLCDWLRLDWFHVLTSKGMRPGWPDLTIIGTSVIYRELKTQAGRLTPEQQAIGARLRAAGQNWSVWRPSDWLDGTIDRELRLLRPLPQLPFETTEKR